jgi:hypothetical protein
LATEIAFPGKNKAFKNKITSRATEIFNSIPASHIASGHWDVQRAPFPTFDTIYNLLRKNLFVYQELRRCTLVVQKRCSELFYNVVKGEPRFLTESGKRDIPSTTLTDLYGLQEAEREYRQKLTSTILEKAIIREIDRLLCGRQEAKPVVPARSIYPGSCQHGEAIRWIMATHGFVPTQPSELALSPPWSRMQSKRLKCSCIRIH